MASMLLVQALSFQGTSIFREGYYLWSSTHRIGSLGNDIQVQSFAHITRNAAIKIFENLLDQHSQHVKPITNEFIEVFIQSITNEKDPRNLMSVYTVIQKIVKLLDISHHVEDLFAATFCYFPITFRPPPDNPYGITAKDLKLNLRKCMASTPLFSEFALPLLQQKMSTTSGSAKKDSLETITACASVYPARDILAVGSKLLDAIKIEIINSSPDPGLRDPSLDAIHAITKAITSNSSTKETDVTKVLKPLVDDCVHLLDVLEEDTVKPASLILRSIASASRKYVVLCLCVRHTHLFDSNCIYIDREHHLASPAASIQNSWCHSRPLSDSVYHGCHYPSSQNCIWCCYGQWW